MYIVRCLTQPTDATREQPSSLAHTIAIAGPKAGIHGPTLWVDMSDTTDRDFGKAIALVQH
jgi:hypothetical protein